MSCSQLNWKSRLGALLALRFAEKRVQGRHLNDKKLPRFFRTMASTSLSSIFRAVADNELSFACTFTATSRDASTDIKCGSRRAWTVPPVLVDGVATSCEVPRREPEPSEARSVDASDDVERGTTSSTLVTNISHEMFRPRIKCHRATFQHRRHK